MPFENQWSGRNREREEMNEEEEDVRRRKTTDVKIDRSSLFSVFFSFFSPRPLLRNRDLNFNVPARKSLHRSTLRRRRGGAARDARHSPQIVAIIRRLLGLDLDLDNKASPDLHARPGRPARLPRRRLDRHRQGRLRHHPLRLGAPRWSRGHPSQRRRGRDKGL